MRKLIQKLGKLNVVIIITIVSVSISVLITLLAFYITQDFTGMSITVSLATIIPLIVAPLTSWPVMGVLMKIDILEREMRSLATYDYLTNLLSRRVFFHYSNNFINSAQQNQVSFSVVALDLDSFKSINDNYGHSAGDEVLKHFALTMKNIMRKDDLIGRIGGDEFAMLLLNTTGKTALNLTEKLHHAIRESVVNYDKLLIKYTISMGVVTLVPTNIDNIESILKKADNLLYQAKKKGRNCTVVSFPDADMENTTLTRPLSTHNQSKKQHIPN